MQQDIEEYLAPLSFYPFALNRICTEVCPHRHRVCSKQCTCLRKGQRTAQSGEQKVAGRGRSPQYGGRNNVQELSERGGFPLSGAKKEEAGSHHGKGEGSI